jgi:hypothetical protein
MGFLFWGKKKNKKEKEVKAEEKVVETEVEEKAPEKGEEEVKTEKQDTTKKTTAKKETLKTEAKKEPTKEETEETEEKTTKKPTKKVYHVSLRKDDGKWQVKYGGGKKAIKLFDTQAEAIKFAEERADSQEGSISIHKKDGKIRKQDYSKKAEDKKN